MLSLLLSCNDKSDSPDEPGKKKSNANGYEYVDLGLSVKWASCNIGANSPEDPGDLYAWGEVEAKDVFNPKNYKHCQIINETGTTSLAYYGGYRYTLTKYCTDSRYGKCDSIKTLEMEDDVVRNKMGGDWRMPTIQEIRELLKNCQREYVEVEESFCVKFIGPNGNYILIPGLSCTESHINNDDRTTYFTKTTAKKSGGIWSSSLVVLYEQAQRNACCLEFHSALPSLAIETGSELRFAGLAVRGVIE